MCHCQYQILGKKEEPSGCGHSLQDRSQGVGQGKQGQVICTGLGHVVWDTGSASNRPWAQGLLGPEEVTNPPFLGWWGSMSRRHWWVGDAFSLIWERWEFVFLCASVSFVQDALAYLRCWASLPCASGTGLDPTPPLPPDLLRWGRHCWRPCGGASWPAGGCQASRGEGQRGEPVGQGLCPGDLAQAEGEGWGVPGGGLPEQKLGGGNAVKEEGRRTRPCAVREGVGPGTRWRSMSACAPPIIWSQCQGTGSGCFLVVLHFKIRIRDRCT